MENIRDCDHRPSTQGANLFLVGKLMKRLSEIMTPGGPYYHGLYNHGATCYLSSVLQVLFMTQDFRQAVESRPTEIETIDVHLRELFEHLKTSETDITAIIQALGIKNAESYQRDAAEYFERILNMTGPHASQIFRGLLRHMTTCTKCAKTIHEESSFWTLPLSVKDTFDQTYSVKDGFKQFFQSSTFGGGDQMYCEECDAKTDGIVECQMKCQPDVLTLLLKRFELDYYSMTYVKTDCWVDVPLTLDTEPLDCTYELYAVVNHVGSLSGGHYTATIKSFEDGSWYEFDDTYVSRTSEQSLLGRSRNAYMLMYRKGVNQHEDMAEKLRDVTFTEDYVSASVSTAAADGNGDVGLERLNENKLNEIGNEEQERVDDSVQQGRGDGYVRQKEQERREDERVRQGEEERDGKNRGQKEQEGEDEHFGHREREREAECVGKIQEREDDHVGHGELARNDSSVEQRELERVDTNIEPRAQAEDESFRRIEQEREDEYGERERDRDEKHARQTEGEKDYIGQTADGDNKNVGLPALERGDESKKENSVVSKEVHDLPLVLGECALPSTGHDMETKLRDNPLEVRVPIKTESYEATPEESDRKSGVRNSDRDGRQSERERHAGQTDGEKEENYVERTDDRDNKNVALPGLEREGEYVGQRRKGKEERFARQGQVDDLVDQRKGSGLKREKDSVEIEDHGSKKEGSVVSKDVHDLPGECPLPSARQDRVPMKTDEMTPKDLPPKLRQNPPESNEPTPEERDQKAGVKNSDGIGKKGKRLFKGKMAATMTRLEKDDATQGDVVKREIKDCGDGGITSSVADVETELEVNRGKGFAGTSRAESREAGSPPTKRKGGCVCGLSLRAFKRSKSSQKDTGLPRDEKHEQNSLIEQKGGKGKKGNSKREK